ncbi:MAG TPA: hypothetical protein VGM50_05910, partial [Gemmatimonadaceae bacterium]
RTIKTAHFAFHYPVELEAWTQRVASRVEAIDSAVARVVGYAPTRRTDVVVDDPYEVANGSAWPFLNRPVINLWATPPDPREDIGEFREWGQMLVSHEFTHIAHLTRPSRNAQFRRLWQALAVDLGPITLNAPRWAIEGYATYAEGKVTGSGRPRGVWRAAYLRQWAIEGQLPRYENLNAWGAYNGGEFAYLAGSAFFEWLVQRPGQSDSSLVYVWRRMTAKQQRSFDEAFIGVFGDSPRTLYGLFAAELTSNARDAATRIHGTGAADTGTVVQRLSWDTGDPAISPDGQRAAIVLRSPTLPSRVVIWRTAPEPDTGRARRDSLLRKSDPEDVPAHPIYPPAKRVLAVLRSKGASYEDPRFLADGRVLLWKSTPQGDGSQRPDLYLWDPRRGSVRRITHGASVRNPDPTPDGHNAYAMHCQGGSCDLVLVSLITGGVTPVLRSSPTLSYYRPRVRPGSNDVLFSVHDSTRWHLGLMDGQTRAVRLLTAGDSVNRYDGAWLSVNEIVDVTEAGGVPNLESFRIDAPTPGPITRLTGAAVAPEPNRRNHSVWFLSLYSRGYDLREVTPSPNASREAPVLADLLAPAMRVASRDTAPFAINAVSEPRPFNLSARLFRWFPAPQVDADGASGVLGLSSNDIIGRSEVLAKLAIGDQGLWHGGAVDLTWRGMRPFVRGEAFFAAQSPSASRSAVSPSSALNAKLFGGMMSIDGNHLDEGWSSRYRLGGSVARLDAPDSGNSYARSLGFGEAGAVFVQRRNRASATESLAGSFTGGTSFDHAFYRGVATFGFSTAGATLYPLAVSATYARTNADAPLFEQLSFGGNTSPLLDRSLLSQRLAMPVLPTGIQVGPSAFAYRLTVRSQPLNAYFWSGSTANVGDRFAHWNRVVGVDGVQSIAAIPMAGTPSARAEYGVGYSLDAPFRKQVRAYLGLVLNP